LLAQIWDIRKMNAIENPTLIQVMLPIIILLCGAMVVVLQSVIKEGCSCISPILSLTTIALAFIANQFALKHLGVVDDGSIGATLLSYWVANIGLLVGALLVLISWHPDGFGQAQPGKVYITGEFFAMMLFSIAGLLLVGISNNLIILFLGLELVSMPTYIMVTLSRNVFQSKEAGLKYFFLGALAAGILAYGFALLYGITGALEFDAIAMWMQSHTSPYFVVPFLLVLTGLCFKIAALPMHFYVGDVYQGASSPVTALLAFMPKIAGFIGITFIFNMFGADLFAMADIGYYIGWTFWILAALTMTVGNTLALMQTNTKRVMAYSSVAHTGYMMTALLVGVATNAILFYMAVYAIATLGIFGVLSLIEKDGDEAQNLVDLRGLARSYPGLAAALAVCIFSLIGMPLTAGFIGKLLVFSALVNDPTPVPGNMVLLVIGLVNAAIGACYYLRILKSSFIEDGDFQYTVYNKSKPQIIGIALASIITIVLGVMPTMLYSKINTIPTQDVAPTAVVFVGEVVSTDY
jgi:NADH-quinone oxidoreductase subunit N